MLKALVEGKHDPGWMGPTQLADYAKGGYARSGASWSWLWKAPSPANSAGCSTRKCEQMDGWRAQVAVLEQEIERRVSRSRNAIRRLDTIPGIDRKTAWTIVSEIGVD